jgi:hypothetical protein
MLPEDAPGVCACARAIYGDEYPRPELYSPTALVEMNARGEWISMVAVAGQEVVGHMALEPLGRVAEMGMGMVLAEHRRHRVLEHLRDFVVAESERIGLAAQFVELELHNLAAQGLANRSPAQPCGLTLGLWPGEPRRSFLRYVRLIERPKEVHVHVPDRHLDVLERIYGQFGVRVVQGPAYASGAGGLREERHDAWGSVFLLADDVGPETFAALDRFAFDVEAAFLEFPIAQEGSAELCARAEERGFFFSGVSPHGAREGDALRLQRLARPIALPAELSHPVGTAIAQHITRTSLPAAGGAATGR